jgi:TonB-linked SusC/RagA family outer membrane protein
MKKKVRKEIPIMTGLLFISFFVLWTNVSAFASIPEKGQFDAKVNEINQNQQKEITGKVTDTQGQPLPGVTVTVKGTTRGTVTDVDGNYSLSNIANDNTLVFSFVGMETQEINVGDQTRIDVTMQESAIALEEVVAIGYGTQKKINLTGAVDVISNEKITNRQASTVSQLLQGAAPSLNLAINNNYGFQPGATMDISIRGIGSLNGGSPYILIDGVPGDMNLLNPEDIESISILKDASSSAIYGARAPYGVILITTKSGKKQERFNVNYNGTFMIETPPPLPSMLNSITQARILNEAGVNGGGIVISEETMDRMIAFQNKDWEYLRQSMPNWPEGATNFGAYPEGNVWNGANLNYANTNWWDIYFGNSLNQKHNLSISGGTKNSSYYLSGGYVNQNSIIQYGTDYYQRANLTGKFDFSISDWWDVSYEHRFSQSTRERPNMAHREAGDYDHMMRHLFRAYPWTPLYNGWGSPEEGGDYMSESEIPTILSGTDKDEIKDLWNIIRTEIRPLKGLKINADFSYETYARILTQVDKTAYIQAVDKTYFPFGTTVPNQYEQTHYQNYYWTTNIFSTYEFSLKDSHNFLILGGFQLEKGNNTQLSGFKTDLIYQDVPSLRTALGDPILSQYLSHQATQGYFARISYNFKNKYLFESNMRYDGSYVFKKSNRWGFFPSFSAGWNIHEEEFWTVPPKYISSLKVRASWGQLGNQNISPYSDLPLLPINTGKLNWIFNYGQTRPVGYTQAPPLVNNNLTWETATTANVGLNIGLLDNKLTADIDLFQRLTTDMVGPSEAMPGVLGANVPQANNATLRTRGWELNLNWKQRVNNNFSYFANLNLYDNKSIVTKYYNPTGTLSTWYEGREVGEIWGYTVYDLFRSQTDVDNYLSNTDLSFIATKWNPGDVKYEDTNNDGKVNNGTYTVNDHGDLSIIGNSEPHLQYGLSAGFKYKNFDFSMLWKGVGKRDYYFDELAVFYWQIMRAWWDTNIDAKGDRLDYFRDVPGDKLSGLKEGEANINTDGFWPRPYLNHTDDVKNRHYANTRYLANAAYLRLQNIQAGFSLPVNLISKLKLQNMRIYFSGENLLTLDHLPKGIDPAAIRGFSGISGAASYGADRIYSLGISITY